MYLPNEILERALQDLPKADLKAARLVNSQWSSCATRFLFDTLYISPHKTNIDVFQSVTQHPVLRHCVKQLCYDGVGFSANWTYPQYFRRLWRFVHRWARFLKEPFDSPDTQVKTFVESARLDPTEAFDLRLSMAMDQCGDFDTIKAAYRKSQELALYQQKCMENYDFARILAVGLQRLDRLSTLSLNDYWPVLGEPESDVAHGIDVDPVSNVEVPAYLRGSPLARSWGIFDARPLDWSYASCGSCHPGNFAFWSITIALPKSVKRIRNFEHEDGVPPAVVYTLEPRLLPGIYAFARLKELKLIITHGQGDATELDSLRGLRDLLHCVRDLEALELGFSTRGEMCVGDCFTYKSVFPRDGTWPRLRRFVVKDLEITEQHLIDLLFGRMLRLQHLMIGDMHLLHGTWERVIEALRFRGLSSFEMSSYYLGYDDDKCFLEPLMDGDEESACRDFIASIERYVVHGWHDLTLRHPSLKKDEPTQDSLNYLGSDYVFGRLPGISGAGDIVRVDVAMLKTEVAEVCAKANGRRDMAGPPEARQLSTELKPNLNNVNSHWGK